MLLRAALVGSLGAAALLAACGSSKRAGNGAECFVATDCQEPLVCIEQKDKTKRCTDNLDLVEGTSPPDGAPPPDKDSGDEGGENEAGSPGDSGKPAVDAALD